MPLGPRGTTISIGARWRRGTALLATVLAAGSAVAACSGGSGNGNTASHKPGSSAGNKAGNSAGRNTGKSAGHGDGQSASPAASPSATDSPPGTTRGSTYTVPLKVIRHGPAAAELVPVYIDGHGPYVFLLDTGSTVSSISRHLAKTLKLPATGRTARIKGVVKGAKVPLVTIHRWRVGQAKLVPGKIAEIKLSHTTGKVAGLLGSDELSRFATVTIDFQRRELRLTRR